MKPPRKIPTVVREPKHPDPERLALLQGRTLDPATALVVRDIHPRSTTYVGPRVIVAPSDLFDTQLQQLAEVAETLGWELTRQDRSEGKPIGSTRLNITVKDGVAAQVPDGWTLLQMARARFGIKALRGVGLDHIIALGPFRGTPFRGTPFRGTPFRGTPFRGTGVESYSDPGSGGRQPLAYVGPAPARTPNSKVKGRRPVVAVMDTGCGQHSWLDGVVDGNVQIDGHPIGYADPGDDPEQWGDLTGPLDGGIDEFAGHGTFICGLIHQACPDADIYSWRVVSSDGLIEETRLIAALADVTELVERARDGRRGGKHIDVLSLSMGYYHETPQDLLNDGQIRGLLRRLSDCGTIVVCSAGNDATTRPMYPAAFTAWSDGDTSHKCPKSTVPVISVGALNPNGTDALFSNDGPWVVARAIGASLMSTHPPFQGGLQPVARTHHEGRRRESMDPDDFSDGFALWSGTSFAAPLLAGQIAAALGALAKDESATQRVRRARRVVWRHADLPGTP